MTDTRFRSGPQHPRFVSDVSLLEELAKLPLGTLRLTGAVEKRARSRRYVELTCSACSTPRWVLVDNIRGGKTRNCPCQKGKYGGDPRAKTLGERYDAMVQRCERETHVSSHRYKGRGIKVLFESREHFIRWALETYPNESFEKVMENGRVVSNCVFDRRDNNGHYSPDNLRLTTYSENLKNKGY